MWRVDFYDYMVSPIIVRNDTCEAIDVFLPDIHCRSWLFIYDVNWCPAFEQVRFEQHAEFNYEAIPSDIFVEVWGILSEQFMKRHYAFHKRILENKKKEGRAMSKNDFSNMQVGSFVNVEKLEGEINVYSSAKIVSGESVLFDLIRANDKNEFQRLLQKADKYF